MNTPVQEIATRLATVEADHDVRVLFACESGSRAWGFASPDSDWDVRFIYAHGLDWYLSVAAHRDVIELPIVDDYDINGWELRKTLRLLRKSNPVLLEWLNSPIQYRCDAGFLGAMRVLANDYYSPAACFHHYLRMARGNWREYLHGPEVKLKKYLYVLRPVLACRWIEAGQGIVPVEFGGLVDAMVTDAKLRGAIASLLARKKATSELGTGAAIPEIDEFLVAEFARLAVVAATLPVTSPRDENALDALLREFIRDDRQARM